MIRHPLKLVGSFMYWPVHSWRADGGLLAARASEAVLDDQYMCVQTQGLVTNRLQSLVTRRLLAAAALTGCAVLVKVCSDNVDLEVVTTLRSVTARTAHAVGRCTIGRCERLPPRWSVCK